MPTEPVTYRAVLIGGPCDQRTVTLTALPALIEAAGVRYTRRYALVAKDAE